MTGVLKTRGTRRTQLQLSQLTGSATQTIFSAEVLLRWSMRGTLAGKKKPCSPTQGTQFWALMRVWEDGTHDFVVPAGRSAIGGGITHEAAVADIQSKLASMVQELTDDGDEIKILDKGQSAYKMKGELKTLNEECEALGIVMPKCKRSKMLQVTLDCDLLKK